MEHEAMNAVVRPDEVTPDQPTSATAPVARVAVLVSLNFPDMDEEIAELVRRFTRVALTTLVRLGAAYELFDTSTPLSDPGQVARCDGLLLLGGGDIDASCYSPDSAQAAAVPHSYGVDARADADALAAIRAAEDARLPLLGICRGSQLINVFRGGTILPDIEDFVLHRGDAGEPMFLDEKIRIRPDSRLREILGTDTVVGRSGHHQAVDRLGQGLVVAARALDGIVEGIEDPTRWLVGVQWHPEDDDGPEADRLRLFGGFVDACAAGKTKKETGS
jgi:putative glutamine amidotransferase